MLNVVTKIRNISICLRGSLALLLILSIAMAQAAPQPSGESQKVLSFSDWKQKQVDQADLELSAANYQLRQKAHDNQEALGDRMVQLARQRYRMATELSVVDYINIYLAKHPHPEAGKMAAQMLSPGEMAELIEFHLKSNTPAGTN